MAQIIHEKPPRFEEISKLFGVTEKDIIFYSYGDDIYSPTGKVPSDDLLVHEATHAEQQAHDKTGAKLWWERFLIDPEWRVQQEAEAFGEQLKWIRRKQHDRNALARAVHQMASSLSSPMYGSAISYTDAMVLIKDYADGRVLASIEDHLPDANPAIN